MNLTPSLKWHGGKHYLSSKLIALMPPHIHYVEPFAGGLSVLLAKDPVGVSEEQHYEDSHRPGPAGEGGLPAGVPTPSAHAEK